MGPDCFEPLITKKFPHKSNFYLIEGEMDNQGLQHSGTKSVTNSPFSNVTLSTWISPPEKPAVTSPKSFELPVAAPVWLAMY